MCDRHQFQFDVDRAYAGQVVATLETSPAHPLTDPQAPRSMGVYALYRRGSESPVYIGEAVGASGIAGRLRDHLRKIQGRRGIGVDEMTCRFLIIERKWESARAEDALICHYDPEWNGVPGFSMHVPGVGRPGRPGYVNEWDQRFPPNN